VEALAAADGDAKGKRAYEKAREDARGVDAAAKRLKEAADKAHRAHMDAEAQFDEADRRLSSGMACEGAQMAIASWEMREKLIRRMEAAGRK